MRSEVGGPAKRARHRAHARGARERSGFDDGRRRYNENRSRADSAARRKTLSPQPLDLSEPRIEPPPRSRARWKAFAVIVLLALLAPTPWLARRGASKLAFFRVRNVVVEGTRYLSPDSVVARLALDTMRSEEHTSELQSRVDLVCRLLLEKKKKTKIQRT